MQTREAHGSCWIIEKRRDDAMMQTRRALGVAYFSVSVSFGSIGRAVGRLQPGERKAIFEWQLQQQLTRSTEEEVGRKGPMRIDELGN